MDGLRGLLLVGARWRRRFFQVWEEGVLLWEAKAMCRVEGVVVLLGLGFFLWCLSKSEYLEMGL